MRPRSFRYQKVIAISYFCISFHYVKMDCNAFYLSLPGLYFDKLQFKVLSWLMGKKNFFTRGLGTFLQTPSPPRRIGLCIYYLHKFKIIAARLFKQYILLYNATIGSIQPHKNILINYNFSFGRT